MAKQCTDTIREIQNISYGLYPPTLEAMGLPAALRHLGQSCEPTIRCQLHCQAPLAAARFDSDSALLLPASARSVSRLALPGPELVRKFLGAPGDDIDCPTPAQALLFGDRRRSVPRWLSVTTKRGAPSRMVPMRLRASSLPSTDGWK